jgi:hypothetical protein
MPSGGEALTAVLIKVNPSEKGAHICPRAWADYSCPKGQAMRKGVCFVTKMQSRKLARGIGIGLAVTGAAAAVGSAVMGNRAQRKVKSKAKQFARSFGDIVDNVQQFVR